MAIPVTDQKFLNSGLYLDSKMQPVKTINELHNIPMKQRFVGMEVVVLEDDGKMSKYWLEGGTKNTCWKKKSYGITYQEGNGISIKDGKISVDEEYIVTDNNLESKMNNIINDTDTSVNKTIVDIIDKNDYFETYVSGS